VKGRNVHRYDSWPDSGPFTKSIQSSLSTACIRIISKFHESRGDYTGYKELISRKSRTILAGTVSLRSRQIDFLTPGVISPPREDMMRRKSLEWSSQATRGRRTKEAESATSVSVRR
jgi:hypothetical protein